MTDREKVIKGLEKCKRYECDDCTEKDASQAPWDCPAYDGLVNDALALLKGKEAKTVIVNPKKYGDYLDHCPSCEKVLPNVAQYGFSKFCWNCGQAIKWKKEYIVELKEEEADELMSEHWVEELVRCKDCKHFSPERLYMCRIHGSAFQPRDRYWFCADGERW